MTRKDYVLIARIIHGLPTSTEYDRQERRIVATQFADALGRENANFNRNKFLTACLGKHNAVAV